MLQALQRPTDHNSPEGRDPTTPGLPLDLDRGWIGNEYFMDRSVFQLNESRRR